MRLTFLVTAALLFAGAAAAQWRDPGSRYPPGYGARERGPFGGPGLRGDIVSRVIYDLERAPSFRFVDRHERKHFEGARQNLLRFRDRWSRGKFDRGRLDRAIDNMKHLANARQVHPADRRMIARHMESLRAFRARAAW